jgi:hypothetical protein
MQACWCEDHIKPVHIDNVRDGIGWACRNPNCKPGVDRKAVERKVAAWLQGTDPDLGTGASTP